MIEQFIKDLKKQATLLIVDQVSHLIDERFALFRKELETTVSLGDLAEEIDLKKLAVFVDSDEVASHIFNHFDLSDMIDVDDIEVDMYELAGNIDMYDLAQRVTQEIDLSDHIDHDELKLDPAEVAEHIEIDVSDVEIDYTKLAKALLREIAQ